MLHALPGIKHQSYLLFLGKGCMIVGPLTPRLYPLAVLAASLSVINLKMLVWFVWHREKYLTLSGNALVCSCELLYFRRFINANSSAGSKELLLWWEVRIIIITGDVIYINLMLIDWLAEAKSHFLDNVIWITWAINNHYYYLSGNN